MTERHSFALVILILTVINRLAVAVEDKEVNIQWKLYKIDPTKHPYAKCIDGSPGGYWFSKGTGTGSHKYVIHHQVRSHYDNGNNIRHLTTSSIKRVVDGAAAPGSASTEVR